MVTALELFSAPSLAPGGWLPELIVAGTVLLGFLVVSIGDRSGGGAAGAGGSVTRVRAGRAVTTLLLAGLVAAAVPALPRWPAPAIHPLGPHFTIDATVSLVRFAILIATFLTVLNLPGDKGGRGAVMLVVAALGLILLAEAATLGGLLLAVAVFIIGAGLAAWFHAAAAGRAAVRRWHLTSTVGFSLLAFGAVLWSGLAGALDIALSLVNLASWPFQPPLALPVILGMLGVGLALVLLGEPGRFAPDSGAAQYDDDPGPQGQQERHSAILPLLPFALTGWLTAVPALAFAALLQRMLQGVPPVEPLGILPDLVTSSAVVLLLGGYLAAVTRRSLERRLAWAATGQVGLALLGFSALAGSAAQTAVLPVLLVFAAAQLGAMILAGAGGASRCVRPACRPAPILMATMLLALAALPPMAGWRPRLVLMQELVAAGQHLGAGLVIAGTLLGCFVYLRPLVDLWRMDPAAADLDKAGGDDHAVAAADAGDHAAGTVAALLSAASLLALLLAWGTGLLGFSLGAGV